MNPRIQRGPEPEQELTRWNFRKALPQLRRDFQDRCAYSMQHLSRAGGLRCMEVDHFDPRQKNNPIQDYRNLMLASRHCNGAKGDYWPSETDLDLGIRLLNPCEEEDYGAHIREDPVTHKLIGLTPPGEIQIIVCDLNAPHLMEERKQRTEMRATIVRIKSEAEALGLSLPSEIVAQLELAVDYMVPEIPHPTGQG
jgi:hypothetical protein